MPPNAEIGARLDGAAAGVAGLASGAVEVDVGVAMMRLGQ
jgi:hypothetical protein